MRPLSWGYRLQAWLSPTGSIPISCALGQDSPGAVGGEHVDRYGEQRAADLRSGGCGIAD